MQQATTAILQYYILPRIARLKSPSTRASLPFLSRRARDQAMHRRWYPRCLVIALLVKGLWDAFAAMTNVAWKRDFVSGHEQQVLVQQQLTMEARHLALA